MKKALLGLLAVLLLFAATFVVVNLGDASLSPAVTARLASRPAIPPASVLAYKYELGLLALGDPASEGARDYDLIRAGLFRHSDKRERSVVGKFKICRETYFYCSPSEATSNVVELRSHIDANRELLTRYEQLVGGAPPAADFPQPFESSFPAVALIHLQDLKAYEWDLKLAAGDTRDVRREWVSTNEFYAGMLRYPQTVLGAKVAMSILKGNREFMRQAMRDDPTLKLSPGELASAQIDASPEDIVKNTELSEFEFWSQVFALPFNYETVTMMNMHDDRRLPIDPVAWLSFAYHRNQTLNELNHDYETGFHLKHGWSLVNPIGELYLHYAELNSPRVHEDMLKSASALRAPFE